MYVLLIERLRESQFDMPIIRRTYINHASIVVI